jgi:hypothetical protein
MSRERRRHPRKRAVGNDIFVRTADGQDGFNLARRVVDLGPRGACVVTVGRLRPGLSVIANLKVPGTRLHVKMMGTVRWSTTLERQGRTAHVAGLEFDHSLAPEAGPSPRPRDLQRRHPRFAPKEVDPQLMFEGLLAMIGVRKPNLALAVRDLSQGGVSLLTEEPLKTGREVKIRLEFRITRSIIEADGVVRWCRRDTLAASPRWLVGVVFKRMPPKSDAELRRLERYFLGGR